MDAVNRQQIPWWDRRNDVSGKRKKVSDSKSWSSYWMDDDSYDFFYKKKNKKPRFDSAGITNLEDAHRLSQLRRAVSNFVRIMTNRTDIKVLFSGGQNSFTNSEIIVISADQRPENFDRVVGTALHEAAHCVFTKNLWNYTKNTVSSASSKRRLMTKHGVNLDDINKLQNGTDPIWVDDQWEIFFTILNFLEDRRIDNEVYKRAPGYRPYYQSMYDHYWNNAAIATNLLRNPELDIPTLTSYKVRIINMTNPATKYTLHRLPGFRDIVNLVDLNDILRLSHPNGQVREHDMMDLAAAIYNIIMRYVIDSEEVTPSPQHQPCENDCDLPNYDGLTTPSSKDETSEDETPQSMEDVEELVSSEMETELPKLHEISPDSLEKEMDDFLEGKVKKENITRDLETSVNALEDSNTSIDTVTVDGKQYDYIRIPRLTTSVYENVIGSTIKSIYGLNTYAPWVITGKRLGEVIVSKIKIRHDKNSMKFSRRKRGKLDPRLIYSLPAGNQNVFFEKIEETYKDTVIYLTLDASSSIDRSWHDIMTMAIGFGYAAKKINNFDIVINVRWSATIIYSITLFDSRIDNLSHLYRMGSAFKSYGGTPESIVYEIESSYIKNMKTPDNNAYFITLTDGDPNIGGSQTDMIKHCRKMMNDFTATGISRMAYFIDNSGYGSSKDTAFHQSYGSAGVVVPMTNFNKIAEALNKFLTSTDAGSW